jgi:hypothetical protein
MTYNAPELVLAKKLLSSHKTNGFTSAIVEGPRGIGKSSYALKVFYDVFEAMDYNETAAWDMALDRVLFRIKDIIQFLDDNVDKEDREIGFIWDDAGVFGSNLTWYTDIKLVHLLQSMMDTVRGSLNGMLLTCTNQGQLLKFLRRYDNHIINISYAEQGGWNRIAKGYIKRTLPSGMQRVYPNFHDYFSCHLPIDIYERYQVKRMQYNKENITALKKAQAKQNVEEENNGHS